MSTTGDPQHPVTADWATWQADLVDRVRGLADEETLVLTAGPGHLRLARPGGRSALRAIVPGRKRPVAPSLRLVRTEDHLRGYLVGATRHGGPFPWTDDEVATILDLGWHAPTVGDGEDFLRFWPDDVPQGPYLPLHDARRAVDVVTRTVRTLLPPPDGSADLPPVVTAADARPTDARPDGA